MAEGDGWLIPMMNDETIDFSATLDVRPDYWRFPPELSCSGE